LRGTSKSSTVDSTNPAQEWRTAIARRRPRGDRGEAAPPVTIQSWLIDAPRYRASPLLSNGTVGAMLELRSLFERYLLETSGYQLDANA
jgi:hypothetical protein